MRVLFTGVFCLISASAHANFWNGNQIAKACETSRTLVIGYVTGWSDKHEVDTKAARDNLGTAIKSGDAKVGDAAAESAATISMGICLPENVTSGQLTDVFCKYLTDHPERRHFTASSLLEDAYNNAFPCKD